jgi:hypothetical protein
MFGVSPYKDVGEVQLANVPRKPVQAALNEIPVLESDRFE